MSISFGSINTGLPKDIVQQIIAAEKIPIQNMEGRKAKFADKIKLLDELIGLMKTLQTELAQNQTSKSFRELKATFPDDLVDVTTDKNIAQTGSYQFEVIQLAQKSSATSSGFEDPDETYLGVGFFSYELPDGTSKEIYIDHDHASLRGLAKLINDDIDNKMMAQVINDGSGSDHPWRMIVSFQDTGNENLVSFPYFYLIDGQQDFFLEFEKPAHNAKVKLNGFEIEVPSNKINKLIPGVTIDLKRVNPGEEFTIKVDEDMKKATEKTSLFIDQINAVLQFINNQNTIDATTDTSKTLGGDITLTTLESRLRSIVFRPYQTKDGLRRLGDLGVTFQKNGLLRLNQEKFESVLNSNYSMVSDLLNGMFTKDGLKTEGFIKNLSNTLELTLRLPDGIIVNRKKGIQGRIDQIDRRIEQRQKIIDQKEKDLKDKFARLEGTISRIKSQGAGLQALTGGGLASPVPRLG